MNASRARARWDVRGGQLGNPSHRRRGAFRVPFGNRVRAAARALSDGRRLVILRLRVRLRGMRIVCLFFGVLFHDDGRITPDVPVVLRRALVDGHQRRIRAREPTFDAHAVVRANLARGVPNLLLEVPLLAFLVVPHEHLLARLRARRHAPGSGADLVVRVKSAAVRGAASRVLAVRAARRRMPARADEKLVRPVPLMPVAVIHQAGNRNHRPTAAAHAVAAAPAAPADAPLRVALHAHQATGALPDHARHGRRAAVVKRAGRKRRRVVLRGVRRLCAPGGRGDAASGPASWILHGDGDGPDSRVCAGVRDVVPGAGGSTVSAVAGKHRGRAARGVLVRRARLRRSARRPRGRGADAVDLVVHRGLLHRGVAAGCRRERPDGLREVGVRLLHRVVPGSGVRFGGKRRKRTGDTLRPRERASRVPPGLPGVAAVGVAGVGVHPHGRGDVTGHLLVAPHLARRRAV
mmetsp:Transcript_5646/g.23944  ORF Transcript_5646/g.23944 Transcript_5646/m.23944 type:complete len:464 (+) Transcript_5646:465-1856(+)